MKNLKYFNLILILTLMFYLSLSLYLRQSLAHEHENHHDHENHCLNDNNLSQKNHHHKEHKEHKAYHNGKLYEIGCCEIGHLEIKLHESGTVEIWLVEGGNRTDTSVRINMEKIKLKCKIKNNVKDEVFDLILHPDPIELAEETINDCSHFIGYSEKLKGKNVSFIAIGKINFKGKEFEIVINYEN